MYLHGIVGESTPCVLLKGEAQELHLSQSVLDGSCGLLAVLQAAMVLGGFSRAQVLGLPHSRHRMLRRLWDQAEGRYFHGATAQQLVHDVDAFAPRLSGWVIRPRRIGHVSRLVRTVIEAGAVPIAGISGEGLSHWSLVIGLERDAHGRHALLLLDPSGVEPQCGLFNARLELARAVRYVRAGEWTRPVRLCELVVVRRAA